METKYEILKRIFGHDSFRDGQEKLIDTLLEGRDVLGVMPTGAGKSMCYQIPALLLPGITLVISPLISLMKDQVGALIQCGVRAAYLNSSLTPSQQALVLHRAAAGEYKIIYVAPERLDTEQFVAFAQDAEISLVAVDEAHCVSHWGQDFRPHYLFIGDFVRRLSPRPRLAAFTATATAEVKSDIIELLGMHTPFEVTTGFDRPNLWFEVERPASRQLALLSYLEKMKDRSGIVYCATRKTVEQLTELLIKKGFSAAGYHAGMPQEARKRSQDAFRDDEVSVMVATNAFGMGIDKSNVGFVLHYNMPKSLEAYYQEAGRAGRDGSEASCMLFYSGQDVVLNEFLISKNDNDSISEELREEVLKRDRARLRDMTFYSTTRGCLRAYILRYFGETCSDYCGRCGSCVTNFDTLDATEHAQKAVSLVWRLDRLNKRFGKGRLIKILRGVSSESELASLKTFGALRDESEKTVRAVLDCLIERGFLACETVGEGRLQVVTLSQSSERIVYGGERLIMKLAREKTENQSEQESEQELPYSKELFARLKKLRKQLAELASVPPYAVFSDVVLRELCRRKPKSREEFLLIKGVGEVKAQRYADKFIAAIAEPENAESGEKTEQKPRTRKKRLTNEDKQPFAPTDEQLSRVEISDEPVGVAIIACRINAVIPSETMRRITAPMLTGWAVGEGYLMETEHRGRLIKQCGERAKELGITSQEVEPSSGESYIAVSYPRKAQEVLINNCREAYRRAAESLENEE